MIERIHARPHAPRATVSHVATAGLLTLVLLSSGCSTVRPAHEVARNARNELSRASSWSVSASAPSGVEAMQPAAPALTTRTAHQGDPAAIAQWWRHFDDPLIATLIDDAQATAPNVAVALARVREARAVAQTAGAAPLPNLTLGINGSRGASPGPASGLATQATVGAQAQWEIDLFGGLRHQREAAVARAEQARFDWHEARVTLAAEVAQTYVDLRSCEALAAVLEQGLTSQRKSAELTREKVRVGFEAPANGALAEASAADASNRLLAQRTDCEARVLGLSVLSGRATAGLRQALEARRATLPRPGQAFEVDRLPTTVLAHRPDIAAAEQALAGAESDIDASQAARWPRLVFNGSIGVGLVRIGGAQVDGASWSFLPSLSLPLFDGGRIAAGIEAAQARRDAAYAGLDARIRSAVREIEEALVRLDAARTRETDALTAAQGFRQYFEAAQARWRIGAGSLIEMEDARRLALNAQGALLGLQRERVAFWIGLYRATGGGWRADEGAAAVGVDTTAGARR